MEDIIGLLRTLDPDGSLPLKDERPCAYCGRPIKKAWPSWASFIAACDPQHAQEADNLMVLELEKGGL